MKKIIEEFKKFAVKGNAVDLAVGVVVGAAFGSIVNSLVADIINPIIAVLTGDIRFSEKVITLKQATADVAAITINYGAFIETIINFIIIALSIFLVVKYMNKLIRKEEKNPTEPPKPSNEENLLTEIRDILRDK